MNIFKYLHVNDRGLSVESQYTKEQLEKSFIVYDGEYYHVFNSVNEYLKSDIKHGNEVIMNKEQRLKFDIDCKDVEPLQDVLPNDFVDLKHLELNVPESVLNMLSNLVGCIMDTFLLTYDVALSLSDICICESCGFVSYRNEGKNEGKSESKNEGKGEGKGDSSSEKYMKYSFHINIPKYCVKNAAEAHNFTQVLIQYLPQAIIDILDAGVNKTTQNFRLVGASKRGDDRVKRIITKHTQIDTICSFTTACIKLDPKTKKIMQNYQDMELNSGVMAEIRRISDEYAKKHHNCRFFAMKDTLLLYKREKPSGCEICQAKAPHDSDNTLYITWLASESKINILAHCRRIESAKQIGSIVVDNDYEANSHLGFLQKAPPLQSESSIAKTHFHGLRKLQYDEPEVKPYTLEELLFVQIQMKMGKTKALRAFIDKYFSSASSTIRMVSFRQTFTQTNKTKFPEFTSYQDVRGQLTQDKLIVQVESLHRLVVGQPVRLLILDEIESILEQFDSGLLKSFSACFENFKWLLRNSDHIICMDANLSDRTYNFFESVIPDRLKSALFHVNTYSRPGQKYVLTWNKNIWLQNLFADLEAGLKIVFASTSLKSMKAVCEMAAQRFPEKRIKMYSSETDATELRKDFLDVKESWKGLDLLAYSPTLSAGISYEEKQFNKLYFWGVSTSCPVETALQMMGRVRDISTQTFCCYFQTFYNNQPTDTKSIIKHFINNKEVLYESNINFKMDDAGRVEFYDKQYLVLWAENTRIKNLSINNYSSRFIEYLKFNKAEISKMASITGEDFKDELTCIKSFQFKKECQEVADAKDITMSEANVIADKKQNESITRSEKLSLDKYRMAKLYEMPITSDFVEKYMEYDVQAAFRAVKFAYAYGHFDNVLQALMEMEQKTNDPYLHKHTKLSQYNRTKIMFEFLKMLGFTSLFDTTTIELAKTVVLPVDVICKNLTTLCIELGLRKPVFKKLLTEFKFPPFFKVINSCLDKMYKMQVLSTTSTAQLSMPLFTINPDGIRPSLIKPVVESDM